MQKLGAFFQCYKNPFATYKCLESFRALYPNAPVLLLSDNGYDYTEMAKQFRCEYIHATESLPVWIEYTDPVSYTETPKRLLKRMLDAFERIDSEYILLLEDDVIVHSEIFIPHNDAALFGRLVNQFSPQILAQLPLQPSSPYYTGHGGSVYRRAPFLDYLRNEEGIDYVVGLFSNFRETHLPKNINLDQLMSLVVFYNGGRLYTLPGHIDDDEWNSDCRIQHQYKKNYKTPMPKELEHLVPLSAEFKNTPW
jgi:hypothetical protein